MEACFANVGRRVTSLHGHFHIMRNYPGYAIVCLSADISKHGENTQAEIKELTWRETQARESFAASAVVLKLYLNAAPS